MTAGFAMAFLAPGGTLLLIDQLSKLIVQAHVADRCICWGPVLRIRRADHREEFYNRGSARIALVLVWLTALVCTILLHRSGAWFQSASSLLGLGLAFGGAAGNLLDILGRRHIVDFIDLRWWPVFNLADMAIVAGLAVALWPWT